METIIELDLTKLTAIDADETRLNHQAWRVFTNLVGGLKEEFLVAIEQDSETKTSKPNPDRPLVTALQNSPVNIAAD